VTIGRFAHDGEARRWSVTASDRHAGHGALAQRTSLKSKLNVGSSLLRLPVRREVAPRSMLPPRTTRLDAAARLAQSVHPIA
jgi:hypothetical protein